VKRDENSLKIPFADDMSIFTLFIKFICSKEKNYGKGQPEKNTANEAGPYILCS
jgi:hypothetical protein